MIKPSPYQISAFSHVARERSFSKAANVMGVTQSAVTQHITKLEKRMQAPLFIRRKDGLILTRMGRDLFDVANRWTTLEQLIEEKIESYNSLTNGYLRITATAPRPSLPIIAKFKEQYPEITIDFALTSWTENMRLVTEREVDIAIFTNPSEGSSLRIHPLNKTNYVAMMKKSHPLAKRKVLSLRDLAHETIILPEDHSLTQRVVEQKLENVDIHFPRIAKMATFSLMKEAILHGIGIGILLDDGVYPATELTSLSIKEMQEVYTDCLVIPEEKQNLRLVKHFVEIACTD